MAFSRVPRRHASPTGVCANRRRLLGGIGGAALLLPLAACTGNRRPEPDTGLRLQVSAVDELNPDLSGRPSPLQLDVFVLRKRDAFGQLDFFSLADTENHAEFTREDRIVLRPGATLSREFAVSPDIVGLGLVAAYRDIGNSRWRITHSIERTPPARFRMPELLARDPEPLTLAVLAGRDGLSLAHGGAVAPGGED